MDANSTRYQLLLGKPDFQACSSDAVPRQTLAAAWAAEDRSVPVYDSVRELLTLGEEPQQIATGQGPASLSTRRGAARDRYGNWYSIAEDERSILVRSHAARGPARFWPPLEPVQSATATFAPPLETPPPPWVLRGLTVTGNHLLIVGVADPLGFWVFDLFSGGPPRTLLLGKDSDVRVTDLAAAPGSGLLVLDRVIGDARPPRLWRLDRDLNVLDSRAEPPPPPPEPFAPLGATPAQRGPRGFDAGAALALPGVDAVAVEALADGRALVLARATGAEPACVWLIDFSTTQAARLELSLLGAFVDASGVPPGALRVLDLAVEARAASGTRIYVSAEGYSQAFGFDLVEEAGQASLRALASSYPLHHHGGRALVSSADGVHYDFGDAWLPLVERRRPRFRGRAVFLTQPLDAAEPACVWHRLVLDAHLPPATQITIESRAADVEAELEQQAFQLEPKPYARTGGSELPYVTLGNNMASWELLFQRAAGRYLQLRITLEGDGRCAPSLRCLRAYFPRFSYLDHYLPAVYREDAGAAAFMERFLANFEGMQTAIEDRIAAVQVLLDPQAAPAEALDWLAGFFGLVLEPSWPAEKRRVFIEHALLLFRRRGTLAGLRTALHLALDEQICERAFELPEQIPTGIRVVEAFRGRRSGTSIEQDPTTPTLGTTSTAHWTPAHGATELMRRFREELLSRVAGAEPALIEGLEYPHSLEQARAVATSLAASSVLGNGFVGAYVAFNERVLGFVPVALAEPLPIWQAFLARRHRRIGVLNALYRTSYSSFDAVPLPSELPADGAPLDDWFAFEAVVKPMRATAHRFRVLLPATPGSSRDEHERRKQLAERIVAWEKPAQTLFEVGFYWAMFRVGSAVVGSDTVVAQSSRDGGLMTRPVLGGTYLGETWLESPFPPAQLARQVVGTDPTFDFNAPGDLP